MAADFVGSSGTLVGAALETAGLYYQSLLLDALTTPLRTTVGALIYVVGAIIALGSFVLNGKFKMWKWLLVGPWLFFFIIGSRVETTGTAWHFGDEARDERLRKAEVERLQGNPNIAVDKLPRVSQVFSSYNRLVSKWVEGTINVLKGSQPNLDAKLLVRVELYASLMSRTIQDSNFRDFLHHTMKRDCGGMVDAYRGWKAEIDYFAASGRKPPNPSDPAFESQLSADEQRRLETFKKRVSSEEIKQVELKGGAWNYLVALAAFLPDAVNQTTVGAAATRRDTFWTDLAKINNGTTVLEQRLQAADQVAGDPEGVIQRYDAKRQELEGENSWIKDRKLTCLDVWNLTSLGLYVEARQGVMSARNHGKLRGIPESETLQSLVYAMLGPRESKDSFAKNDPEVTGAALDRLEKAVAAYILRNEMGRGSTAAFISDYQTKGKAIRQLEVLTPDDMAFQEKMRLTNAEGAERSRMVMGAANLPYYQGIGLYFLAAVFPLFALLLLVPGKHEGFLLWFLLWLWLKSWDVGFAVVMLLDSTLFSIMTLGGRTDGVGVPWSEDKNLTSLLTSFSQIDSTFQLGMYYGIVATAIHSIPVISSYLILGMSRGGRGLLAEGISAASEWNALGVSRWSAQGIGNVDARIPLLEMKVDYAKRSLEAYKNGQSYLDPLVDIAPPSDSGSSASDQLSDPTGGAGLNRQASAGERAQWTRITESAAHHSEGIGRPAKTGFGDPWNPSLMNGTSGNARQRAAENAARAQGIASGIAEKFMPTVFDPATAFTKTGRAAEAATFLQDRAGAATDIASAIKEVELKMQGAERDRAVKWASFYSLNSSRGQALNSIYVLLDNLPLPWTEGSPYEKDMDVGMTAFEQNMKLNAAAIKSINTAVFGKDGPLKDGVPKKGPWSKKGSEDYKSAVWRLAYATVGWEGVDYLAGKITEAAEQKHLEWKIDPDTGEWVQTDPTSLEAQRFAAQQKALGQDVTKEDVPDKPDGSPGEGSAKNIPIVPVRVPDKL